MRKAGNGNVPLIKEQNDGGNLPALNRPAERLRVTSPGKQVSQGDDKNYPKGVFIMTLAYCNKWTRNIRSIRDLEFALVTIRDTAHMRGEYVTANAYSDALYYISTGRLSAECCWDIIKNIRSVCKKLNGIKEMDTEAVGAYLKSLLD